MYWFNNQTEDRFFIYFYKTTDYSGKLLAETDEGKVFWTAMDKFNEMRLAPGFKEFLPVLLDDRYSEAYCSWNDDMNPDLSAENPWGIVYR